MKIHQTKLTEAHWKWMATDRIRWPGGWAPQLPSTVQIRAAERRLGCMFDPVYVRFLQEFGAAMIGADPMYGIGSVMDCEADVVAETLSFRSDKGLGVDDWYVVSNDGRGGPIGIAPDGKVWLSDHGEIVPIAKSFPAYLAQRIYQSDENRRGQR